MQDKLISLTSFDASYSKDFMRQASFLAFLHCEGLLVANKQKMRFIETAHGAVTTSRRAASSLKKRSIRKVCSGIAIFLFRFDYRAI